MSTYIKNFFAAPQGDTSPNQTKDSKKSKKPKEKDIKDSLTSAGIMVYESMSSSLNVTTFIKELCAQLIPHITIPLLYLCGANFSVYLHLFWPLNSITIQNHISSILLYLVVFTYFMVPMMALNSEQERGNFSDFDAVRGSIIIPLLSIVLHRLCISLKYALLSDAEYQSINMYCKSFQASLLIQNQLQVINAWQVREDNELIKFEIAEASIKCGFDLSNQKFVVEDPASLGTMALSQYLNWKQFIFTAFNTNPNVKDYKTYNCDHILRKRSDGNYEISLMNVAFCIMKNVTTHAKISTKAKNFRKDDYYKAMRIVSLILIIIPYAFLAMYRVYSGWTMAYLGLSTVTTYLMFQYSFQFLGMLFLDANRRVEEAKLISDMMRVSDINLHHNIDGSLKKRSDIVVALKNAHAYHDVIDEEEGHEW